MVRSDKGKTRVRHTPDRVEDIHKKKVDGLIEDELLDDTMYGEIIPSLMGWTSSEEQEERTNRLIQISDSLNNKANKGKNQKQ
jgi:formylmethanofuran dehydrogenase subunit B